jgi:glycosyltransferase involved in cell wall biosynthesis
MKRRICLVSAGLHGVNLRLQPWRYLFETARGLSQAGHHVTVLTDHPAVKEHAAWKGIPLIRLPSVSDPFYRRNHALIEALIHLQPEIILWHTGLTSFLHQKFFIPEGARATGIFTSPLYRLGDLMRLGLPALLRNPSLSAIHLIGSLLPHKLIRRCMHQSGLVMLVTETRTTAQKLTSDHLWRGPLQTIMPGVDDFWFQNHRARGKAFRETLGFKSTDKVILYFGSPAPLRGLPVLRQAFQLARTKNSTLRLLILSRNSKGDEQTPGPDPAIQIVNGFLDVDQVAGYVSASDVVALPFLLVPSDAPLSVLEACAQGKPIVTTRVACLPELAERGRAHLAEPGDPVSLADALLQAAADESTSAYPPRLWADAGVEWSHLVENL